MVFPRDGLRVRTTGGPTHRFCGAALQAAADCVVGSRCCANLAPIHTCVWGAALQAAAG
jgi:hypothetical protein